MLNKLCEVSLYVNINKWLLLLLWSTASKFLIYFSLPYTGSHGLQIRTQLIKLLSSAFTQISLRFVFRPSVRLGFFFPVKNRIPDGLKSHVVYLFTRQCCKALYVGQTSRQLHTRISDHMGISPLTGNRRVNPSPTSILSHHIETGHPISFSDFKILSSSPSASELLLKESLLINKLKPILNGNIGSMPLSLF